MRRLPLLLLAGVLVLSACDNSIDPISPEITEPLYHVVEGDPALDADNAYSMYYFDLDLRNDFVFKLAQQNLGAGGIEAYECTGNPEAHGDLTAYPTSLGPADMHPASGFGWFVDRNSRPWKRGSLRVTGACWFDEWNGEGFPESAVVWGTARVGWRRYKAFQAVLKSAGFPAEGHLNPLQLDVANITVEGVTAMTLFGELHHEDGTTLLK
jgi:hypothetical protein